MSSNKLVDDSNKAGAISVNSSDAHEIADDNADNHI
jgi:hypothetical protein